MAEFGDSIDCRGLVEVVTDYLEGALTHAQVAIVERHLDECEGCRHYLEQMRTTIQVVGRLREDDVPPELKARLMTAFREVRR